MNRLFQSTLGSVLLVVLVALAGFQVWQLHRIEALLLRGVPTPAGVAQPVATSAAAAPADCKQSAWWKSDVAATAEPGNLLKAPKRCRVDDAQVVRGGTLRRIWPSDPNGLSPYGDGGQSVDVREINAWISGWLAYPDPDRPSEWIPELAQSISTPDEGLTYVIRLRQGVAWHTPQLEDGNPKHDWLRGKEHELTADDYVIVFQNILDPTLKMRFAVLRSGLEELTAVEKVDKYTFKVVFKKRKFGNLLNFIQLEPLASWLFAYDEEGRELDRATIGETLPKHWYNQKGMGVGPYRFKEWKQGESVVLARNPTYWGEPASFDAVNLRIIKDKAAWPRELENQALDMTTMMPAQYRTTVLDAKGPPFGNPRVKVGKAPGFSYFYVGWNQMNPRLTDKRVRQALSMAVDRQSILDNVYYGLGELISGPLTPDHPCYDTSIAPYPYDPARAGALLEAAGWIDADKDGVREQVVNGERLDLQLSLLLYGGSEEWATIGNAMKESYRKVGVGLELVPLEWPMQQQRMKERSFDAYSGSWSMPYDYDPRGLWDSASADVPGSQNYIGFRNPEMDRMIDGYDVDFDEASRNRTCKAMHALVHEEEPYMFMFSRVTPVLWWDWLNDVEFFPVTPQRDIRYWSFSEARP